MRNALSMACLFITSFASTVKADLSVTFEWQIHQYDVPTGAFISSQSGGGEAVMGLHWTSGGTLYSLPWSLGYGKIYGYDYVNSQATLYTPQDPDWLPQPGGITAGANGNIFVTIGVANAGPSPNTTAGVRQFNPSTGAFIDDFMAITAANIPYDLEFVPDGSLFTSWEGGVAKRDGATNLVTELFLTSGLSNPKGLAVGPDGNLYVASFNTDSILKFNPSTGALLGTFVTAGAGGLDQPLDIEFGPDGNLYVSSIQDVLRFDGLTGAFLGIFADTPVFNSFRPGYLSFGPELPEPGEGIFLLAAIGTFLHRRRALIRGNRL